MNVILGLLLVLVFAQESSVPIKELRNAPAEIEFENKTLRLTAYAWRDFAPGAMGPNGSALMVAFEINTPDKKPLPNGVRVDRAWVLFGEEVWEVSDLRNRIPNQDHAEESWINCSNSQYCNITLRDGPKWGPGVDVDVIVRFTDTEGKPHFLQVAKKSVVATN